VNGANWFFLTGDISEQGRPEPFLTQIHPSCRYLPSRVLAWLCYDAHWLHQASGVITALEALTQPPDDWVTIVYHPLVGFDRLQGITHSLTAWEAAPPWVWPLSAPSSPDVTCSLPTLHAPRPQVFATSRQDSVRDDLWVCSTPQALLGYGLQRLNPG